MKKIFSTIAALSLLVTSSAIPAVHAADIVPTSAAIGFEDGNIYAAGLGGGTKTLSTDAADGSKYAIDVTLDSNAGEVIVDLGVKAGQTYEVSAKVKPIANGEAGSGVRVLLNQASGGDEATQLKTASGAVTLTMSQWNTVSGTINATTTDTKKFRLRYGTNNNNSGSHFLIDDIVIRPVISENDEYVVDMNFDNADLTNNGTSGTADALEDAYSAAYINNTGGKLIQVNNVYGDRHFITLKNVLLKPNTTYKITYDMNQMKGFAKGKCVRIKIGRGGYHYRFDGTTQSLRQLKDAYSDIYEIKDVGWESVTQYITTSDIDIFDEQGLGTLTFDFYQDSTCTKYVGGDSLKFEFDNFKVQEVNIPNGAYFENGQLPKTSSGASVAYDAAEEALNVTASTADGASDVLFGLGIENNTDYVLSYDVKGTEGMGLKPIVYGSASGIGTYINAGNAITLTNDWQTYTTTFNYTTEPYTYPQLWMRVSGKAGNYQIKNIKVHKKLTSGIYAISCGELKPEETSAISFADYASDSIGYVYSIYAKNSAGDKIVYASGTTDAKTVNYKVNAPAGTELYMSAAAIAADNTQSAFTETKLGTVTVVKEFSINLRFNRDADEYLTGGSAAVVNDNTERKLNLYIAQYNGNQLVKVNMNSFTIAPNAEDTFTVETTEQDGIDGVKLFAWDAANHPYKMITD